MKLVAAGECCLDYYEGEDEPRLGGITFNFALHAARAFPDAEIHLLSAVGEDARAAFVVRLEEAGIRHDLFPAARTPSIGIRLDADGERTFHSYDPGGLLDWEVTDSQRETIARSDLVVLTRYHEIASVFERLVRIPTRARRVVDYADISGTALNDVNTVTADRDFADLCLFGLSPREISLRERLLAMAHDYGGTFVVTLANEGAMAITRQTVLHQAAYPVASVVDTTGAGDCFAAHFLSRWYAQEDLETALDAGCRAASFIIQKRGAN